MLFVMTFSMMYIKIYVFYQIYLQILCFLWKFLFLPYISRFPPLFLTLLLPCSSMCIYVYVASQMPIHITFYALSRYVLRFSIFLYKFCVNCLWNFMLTPFMYSMLYYILVLYILTLNSILHIQPSILCYPMSFFTPFPLVMFKYICFYMKIIYFSYFMQFFL